MSIPTPAAQLQYFRKRQNQIVDTIQQLVEIESPSDVKAAVDRLGTVLASRFRELGGRVRLHKSENFGNHLEVRFLSKLRNSKPVLLLGHMDTVHAVGTIAKMPCRVAKGRVFGPGVLDMKSGIALALHAIEALLVWTEQKLPRPLIIFLVSDEEVGSQSSRAITEALARESAAALVLEPAHGLKGSVKTSRKGVGEYRLKVEGKAAHSGLEIQKGQSAVVELAKQILQLPTLTGSSQGTTLNVGKISGGTRVNVVPADALALMDVRVTSREQAAELHRKLTELKPFNPNCRLTVTGRINRPPMERTNGVALLYGQAVEIAAELGWELEEAAVGGGSDGNFTAALGIPTLDGLGAVGEGAHATHESVVISELPRRAALLVGLIERV